VLGRYSRLWVDLNRPVASPTLARTECDGQPVGLNVGMSDEALMQRLRTDYLPYHLALELTALASGASTAVSVHTYTTCYQGQARDFEVGVLHSNAEAAQWAADIARAFNAAGMSARVNEPWSGLKGIMYSADCFRCNGAGREALMLEFRNDVCTQPSWRAEAVRILAPLLKRRPADR
jgi:predicted N-formylglutamate amidohydrolase